MKSKTDDGASRLSAGLEFLGFRYAKVTANFNCQVIVDFIVPWDSASPVCA
jgi:hypothetical protein